MSSDVFARTAFPRATSSSDQDDASARAAGYAAGYSAGMRHAREELERTRRQLRDEHDQARRHDAERVEQLVDVLNTALKSTLDVVVPKVAEAYDELRDAACQLAEAVIGRELADGQRAAASIVARTLGNPEVADALEIRLSSADLAALDDETRARIDVPLKADPALGRGDGVVRFTDGYLDARISHGLERAKRALREEAGS